MLIFLWPNRIIEPLFAAIRLTERTGNGRERAMANGVVFGTKPKPAPHQFQPSHPLSTVMEEQTL
jgi:hypothetical protein